MKKILLLLLVLPLTNSFTTSNSISEDIFSISQSNIITKSKFINPLYDDSERVGNFSIQKSINISSKNNAYVWNLNFLRYSDATNADPGDYECIEIQYNGSVICKLKNDESWAKIENALRSYTNNEYFIPVYLNETSTALILTGCQYPSDIQLLTIIVIEKDKAKLVFNRGLEINRINNINNSFSMILQSNMQEEKTDPIISHRIWSENGVLKFENI